MVQPTMEYATAVEEGAARWAFDDYGQYNFVTSMLKHFGWVIL